MISSPRFLQIFNTYEFPGGEEASVHRVRRSISEQHFIHPCLFSSRDWQGPGAPSLPAQALRMWRNPESLARIRSAHEEHQSNLWLLHNLFPVASAAVYPLARKMNIPTIQYIHNFRPFSVNGYLWTDNRIEPAGLKQNFWPEIKNGAWQNSKAKTAWYALILSYLHRSGAFHKVDAWIAISEFMKTTFVQAGIPESKVFCIPHSWEITEPVSSSPEDKGYYLFLGRLSIEKGVLFLLDVWDDLSKEKGSKCPFLYICGEGPLEMDVIQRCLSNSKIRFMGKVTGQSKLDLIRECRSMIAPSLWWEPLGLVTYEAYEHQKPMLAASSGGLTETVQDGKTGLLHRPGYKSDLIGHILDLENNPDSAKEFGLHGRQWLLTMTTKDQWLEKFNRVLKTL